MKPNYSVSKRMYCSGKAKVTTFRLPEALLKELKRIAAQSGLTTTHVVTTALDNYVQWSKANEKLS